MVGSSSDEIANQLPLMAEYVREHPEVNNVLISGGDAFILLKVLADYDRNYGRVRLYDCAWDRVFYDDTINKAAEKQQYGRLLNW